ncbi:MAG: glycosyltransferase [Pseudomonadota bacterium]|nr:glycosyltransferase [Pseudomonadota bacterium]
MSPAKLIQVGKYFPPHSGGMESVLYDLTTGIDKREFNVKCLVTGTTPHNEIHFVNGVPVYKMSRPFEIASTPISFSFMKRAKSLDADLLHVHLPNPLATLALRKTKVPYVITYHCDVLSYPWLNRLYLPLLREQLAQARAIITSSFELVDNSPVLRDFKNKCRVIPFGINKKSFALTPSLQQMFDQLKNNFNTKTVVYVGRLVEYKGLAYLIRAMKRVDAVLLLVGDGPEQKALQTLAHSLGLTNKVHFFRNFPRHDLGVFYHLADVVVLPSIDEREAFGMCLIEGLACGCPLVTTDIPSGVKSVNVQNVTGLTVPPKDHVSLAMALNTILGNDSLRARMSANAEIRFHDLFRLERMVESHQELYREVLNGVS